MIDKFKKGYFYTFLVILLFFFFIPLTSADLDTLRPDDDGHELDWTPSTGSDHFVLVDEVTPDDADNLSINSGNQEDYWTIENLSSASSVSYVEVWVRTMNTLGNEEFEIRIADTTPTEAGSGDIVDYDTFTDHVWNMTTNPITTSAWTEDDVNNLEIGIRSRTIGGWSGVLYVSQAWAVVSYTPQEAVDEAPNVTLYAPPNNTLSINESYNFTCEVADDQNVTNTTFYVWYENDTIFNQTTNDTSYVVATNITLNISNFISDIYKWNCLAYDNNSNSSWADENFTLNVYDINDVGVTNPMTMTGGTDEEGDFGRENTESSTIGQVLSKLSLFERGVTETLTFANIVDRFSYFLRGISNFVTFVISLFTQKTEASSAWVNLSLVNPSADAEYGQYQFNEFTTEVCCQGANCGEINVSLDPTVQLQDADTENLEDAMFDEDSTRNGELDSIFVDAIDGTGEVGFLKFNLSSLPAGKKIDSAVLALYAQGGSTQDMLVYKANNYTWVEGEIDAMCGDSTYCSEIADNGFFDTLITTYNGDGADAQWEYVSTGIGGAVQTEYSAGKLNITFVLNNTGDAADAYTFFTKEHVTPSLRPYLNVTYSDEDSVISLSSPADDATDLSAPLDFLANITNPNVLAKFELWTNTTGTWHLNQTKYPEKPTGQNNDYLNNINMGGAVVYLRCNNATGNDNDTFCEDISGNGMNATIDLASNPHVSSPFNKAVSLDGVNDHIEVVDGTGSALDTATGAGQNRSWGYWINIKSLLTNRLITDKDSAFGGNHLWSEMQSTAGSPEIRGSADAGATTLLSGALNLNQWYCVVFTFEELGANDNHTLFIDGVNVDENSVSGAVNADDNSPFVIGATQGGANGVNATMDEIFVLNKSLSEAEVASWCNVTKNYKVNFTIDTIPDGTYVWNVNATTLGDTSNFATSNFTYTIGTTTEFPDISSLIYNNNNFSVTNEEAVGSGYANGLFFSSDGTKMYVVGYDSDDVHQYNLSTAWDTSSAVYYGNYTPTEVGAYPIGLAFSSDGTKFYSHGLSLDDIYEYALSDPWNITSASFTSNDNVLANSKSLAFSTDGTRFYVIDSSDNVRSYTLAVAWDSSTLSIDSETFSVGSQETSPLGVSFNYDGTRMYVVGGIADRVFQYALSDPWNVTSATYNNVNLSVNSEDGNPMALFVEQNVTKLYILGADNDMVFRYEEPAVGKTGLIPEDSGTPFWVNSSNPVNISLNQGECENVTWWVNATGDISSTNYTFFAFANLTSDMSISNVTDEINITIVAGVSEYTRTLTLGVILSDAFKRTGNLIRSIFQGSTISEIISRLLLITRTTTETINFNSILERLLLGFRISPQEITITESTLDDSNLYLLDVTDPSTGSPETVNADDNITIIFNFTKFGSPITSDVNVTNITIGGSECSILGNGGGSTTLQLQDNETDILEDGVANSGDSNREWGALSSLYILNDTAGTNKDGLFKFNLSQIPESVTITEAQFCLWQWHNGLDSSSETMNLTNHLVYSNYTPDGGDWLEGSGLGGGNNCDTNEYCWDKKPNISEGEYNATGEDQRDFFGGAGEPDDMWQCWNSTQIINYAYSNSYPNVSIQILVPTATGATLTSDDLIFYSKEHTDASLRPYLNITYSSGGQQVAYNATSELWEVNCTVPSGSGLQDLTLYANYTTDNTNRTDIESNSIQYSGVVNRLITLALTISDAIGEKLFGIKDLSETLNLNSILDRIFFPKRLLTDNFSLSDVVNRFLLNNRITTGIINFNDILSRFFFGGLTTNQEININLNQEEQAALNIQTTQSFSISNIVSYLYEDIGNIFDRAVTQNINFNDALDKLFSGFRINVVSTSINEAINRFFFGSLETTQNININDNVDSKYGGNRINTQAFSLSEIISRFFLGSKSTNQNINFNEDLNRETDLNVQTSQSFSIGNVVSTLLIDIGNIFDRTATLAINIGEGVGRFFSGIRGQTQGFSIYGIADRLFSGSTSPTQNININGEVDRSQGLTITTTQPFSFNLVLDRFRGINIEVIQSISVDAVTERLGYFYRFLSQVVNFIVRISLPGDAGVPADGGLGGHSGLTECYLMQEDYTCHSEYYSECPIKAFENLEDCEEYADAKDKIPRDIKRYLDYFGNLLAPDNPEKGRVAFAVFLLLVLFCSEIILLIKLIKKKRIKQKW